MKKSLLVGIAAIMLWLLLGCTPTTPSPPPIVQVSTWAEPTTGKCTVDVIIDRPGNEAVLDVKVQAEPGILFTATNSVESGAQRVQMLAEDQRRVRFPCRLDTSAVRLSGAYAVRAHTTYAGTAQPFHPAIGHLYILAPPGQQPHLVASAEAFDRIFSDGYVKGTGTLAYRMLLDQSSHTGVIYVRIPGATATAAPTLHVKAAGAVNFEPLPASLTTQIAADHTLLVQLPPIAKDGLRIVPIPFSVEPSAGPGRYTVQFTADYHSHQVKEVAPQYLQVAAGPDPNQPFTISVGTGNAVSLSTGIPSSPPESGAPPTPDPPPSGSPGQREAGINR